MDSAKGIARLRALVAVAVAVAGTASACLSPSLPEVSDEVVNSVEGETVAIVARHEEPNPGEDWIDTRVVVEVIGPDPHLDDVKTTLTGNGWEVRDATYSPSLLLEAEKPDASLGVMTLDEFISMGIQAPNEEFSTVDVKPQNGYFVITLLPHL